MVSTKEAAKTVDLIGDTGDATTVSIKIGHSSKKSMFKDTQIAFKLGAS